MKHNDNQEMDMEQEYLDVMSPYFTWDFQIKACQELSEVSELEKQRAIAAFQHLREFLGEDFPKTALTTRHPIDKYFINNVPWTKVWFRWLSDSIRELEGNESFSKIIKKLKSPVDVDFEEACFILECALKFTKARFSISFEEEVFNSSKQLKRPDLKLVNEHTQEIIYVEITRLLRNSEFENLTSGIIHSGIKYGKQIVDFSGTIFKNISREHYAQIISEVEAKVKKAVESKSFQEISHPGAIELAIAPKDNQVMKQWIKEKSFEPNAIRVPRLDIISKIAGKIKYKSHQVSANHANILVIKHEDAVMQRITPVVWIEQLEETLYKHEDIMAVIIIGYEFGGLPASIESFGMNYFVRKTERHALGSHTLVLINKLYKKVPITIHSLNKVIDAFIQN
jgi:hypothetical protein